MLLILIVPNADADSAASSLLSTLLDNVSLEQLIHSTSSAAAAPPPPPPDDRDDEAITAGTGISHQVPVSDLFRIQIQVNAI